MHWDRFDKKPAGARRGGKAAGPPLTDQNRHLRELNDSGPVEERGNRRQIPRQNRLDLETQLETVLDTYTDDHARKIHASEMRRLLTKVVQTQTEYALSADRLDASPRHNVLGLILQPFSDGVVFLFDWVILSWTFSVLIMSVFEKMRPAPEPIVLYGAAAFVAFMFATGIKGLAKLAVKYGGWTLFCYVALWFGLGAADFYFLMKQEKLNAWYAMVAAFFVLAGLNYAHARSQHERPAPRRDLLLDYASKYDLFSEHYFHWEKSIRAMRVQKELALVTGDMWVFEELGQPEPEQL